MSHGIQRTPIKKCHHTAALLCFMLHSCFSLLLETIRCWMEHHPWPHAAALTLAVESSTHLLTLWTYICNMWDRQNGREVKFFSGRIEQDAVECHPRNQCHSGSWVKIWSPVQHLSYRIMLSPPLAPKNLWSKSRIEGTELSGSEVSVFSMETSSQQQPSQAFYRARAVRQLFCAECCSCSCLLEKSQPTARQHTAPFPAIQL